MDKGYTPRKEGKTMVKKIAVIAAVAAAVAAVAAAVHFTLYMAVNFCYSGSLSAKNISS